MAPYAFATLLTSDHYLPGALALAAALKDVHDSLDDIDLVCLVTPETVDVKSIKLLRRAFNHVIGVEVIEQQSPKGLELLGLYLPYSFLTRISHASVSQVVQTSRRFSRNYMFFVSPPTLKSSFWMQTCYLYSL
jgi:hypothetical protein